MNTKSIMLGAVAICGGVMAASACTGISLKAKDGSYVQARTIENANEPLPSEYVIIPRGQEIVSFTPVAANGLKFKAKYGVVGMSVVRREFIAEGINEAGLSAGLFFFPTYGSYMSYDATDAAHTLGDLQVPTWILANFATIDELKEGIKAVDLLAEKTAVFPSKGEMRKTVQGGGVMINKDKLTAFDAVIGEESLLNGKYILAQRGKKNYFLIIAK